MKEMEDDTNKWKDIQCSWTGRTLLKCPYYAKWATDSMQSLLNSCNTFYKNRKKNSKIHREPQKTPNSQSNLKKNKLKALHFLILKIHYKATVIKTCCLNKERYTDQLNRTEINPHIYGQLIFNKGIKNR